MILERKNAEFGFYTHVLNRGVAFGARWVRSEVNVEDFMLIRIRCRDKVSASTQQPDVSMVKTETMHFSLACYSALETVFGMLCGYI